MRPVYGRRVFLLILVLAFAIISITAICKFGGVRNNGEAEVTDSNDFFSYKLDNESLFLSIIDDETMVIEGAGSLKKTDLDALFSAYDIDKSDIKNLILGNEITELGYDCINGFEYLVFLRLGDGLACIKNGAVRNLHKLRYVYVPTSIKKFGLDFLYGCDKCFIVTEGAASYLSEEIGVSEEIILDNIKSFDDLVKRGEKGVYTQSFDSTQLVTDDPNYETPSGNKPLVIHSGFRQYGPFATLQPGEYYIEVLGSGFDALSDNAVNAFNFSEWEGYSRSEANILQNKINYDLNIEREISNFEFCITNTSEKNVTIDEINIYVILSIPEECRSWF